MRKSNRALRAGTYVAGPLLATLALAACTTTGGSPTAIERRESYSTALAATGSLPSGDDATIDATGDDSPSSSGDDGGALGDGPQDVGVDSPSCVSVLTYGAIGDGVTDNTAAFQAGAIAQAGTGVPLCVPVGPFLINNTVSLPSNLTIVGSPGAVIIGNLTSGEGSTKATFLAQWTANGVNSTLASASVPGTPTILSNTSYAPGQQISIQSAAHTFQLGFYTIQSVSGSGPYTLTLDRPVLRQFASGDAIKGLGTSIPTNIHLQCNGMKFTGSPLRHVEFGGTSWSSMDGCVADASLGAADDYWFSFDVGGLNNTFSNMRLDCGNTPGTYGLALETQEGSQILNSTVVNANVGYLLLDSIQANVTGSQATACNYGVMLSGEDGVVGCSSSRVVGGHYDSNTAYGIWFDSGSGLCSAESLTADQNGSVGVFFGGGGQSQTGNRLVNVDASQNRTFGVWIRPGASGTAVNGLTTSNNGFAGVAIQDDALLTNISANNSFVPAGASLTSQVTLYQTAGYAIVSGLTINDTQTTSNSNIDLWGGTMDVANATVNVGPTNLGVNANIGTVRLMHAVFAPIGAKAGEVGVYTGTSGVVQLGEAVDVTACSTPISGSGSATLAQGAGIFASTITSGTETLTQVQAQARAIQTTQSLTGNVRENVPAGLSGLQYVVYNNAVPNGYTWSVGVVGGAAVALAPGERATLQSDGVNMQRPQPGR